MNVQLFLLGPGLALRRTSLGHSWRKPPGALPLWAPGNRLNRKSRTRTDISETANNLDRALWRAAQLALRPFQYSSTYLLYLQVLLLLVFRSVLLDIRFSPANFVHRSFRIRRIES